MEWGSVTIKNCLVRRAKARFPSGWESRPATIAPAGSNRSSRGGNEAAEAFGEEGPERDLASVQAVTRVNAEQASKIVMRKPTRRDYGEGCHFWGEESEEGPRKFRRGIGDGMYTRGRPMQHGRPYSVVRA